MRKLLLATTAVALSAGAVSAEDIKIGVILGFTGPIESLTPQMGAAAEMAMAEVNARACTDVTGFGLMGHACNIARASQVTLSFDAASLPVFEGALELARAGVVSGGSARGKAALGDVVRVADGVDPDLVRITFDAETSGGLLICVPAEEAGTLEKALQAQDVPVHPVGEVLPAGDHSILLR